VQVAPTGAVRDVAPVDASRIDASFSPDDDFIKEKP
jgi:hypothetical protein